MSLIHEVSDIFNSKVYPESWQKVELNKIVKIQNGYAFKSSKFNSEYRGMPLIRIRDIKNSSSETFYEGDILEEYIVNEGDLLIGMDGDFNSNLWKGIPALLNQRVCRLFPNENIILKKLVYYGLPEFLNKINENTSSTTVKHLSSKSIGEIPFPLPPLSEQNRIVEKLDRLFGQLEVIKSSMEKIPVLLKNFRQQVLTQAVTGKLTEEWREGKELEDVNKYYKRIETDLIENYKALVEKAIQSGNTKPKNQKNNKISDKGDPILQDIPNTWKYYRAEELCYLITDGVHFKPNYIENGVKFLSVKNVRPFKINSDNCKFISEEDHLKYIQRCNPETGDILYTKVGATYGYAAKIDLAFDFSIFVSLALIKPSKLLNSSYIELLFNSPIIFNQANFKVSGIGVPDLHLVEIRDFKIPLASLEEQQEIVLRVESLFSKADAIEEKYKNLKAKIETLPQTILHKAFKGELSEQLETDGDARDLLEEIVALKNGGKAKKVVSKKYVQPDEVLRIVAEADATE